MERGPWAGADSVQTGPKGCGRMHVYAEAWDLEDGAWSAGDGCWAVAWRADHMHSSRFLKRHLLTTVRHSPSTLPLCLYLRVIPLVFLICSAVTCLAIAPGCTLPSLPLLDP
jgi:hypothetical protein